MFSCKFLESFYYKTLPGIGFLKVKKGLELVKIKLLGTRATFYIFFNCLLAQLENSAKKDSVSVYAYNP